MTILDIRQVEAQIRRIARIGIVSFSSHCKNESMSQRGVDSLDIIKVLKTGVVSHECDPDNEMKFRVVGQDLRKEELTVIIDLYDEDSLSVITVW
jgi:hypothetical protein